MNFLGIVLKSYLNLLYRPEFNRSISEFQEYVLIDQYGIAIEQYTKTGKDTWLFRAYGSDAEKILLTSVDMKMTITDIYEGVEFNLKNIKDT
jgi:Uma2 family endonuclease